MKTALLLILVFSINVLSQVKSGPIVGAVDDHSATFLVKTYTEQKVRIKIIPLDDINFFTESIKSLDTNFNYVKIKVDNLKPDTKYYYQAEVDGILELPINSFTTFPEKDNIDFSFGFASCQQSSYAKWDPKIFPVIAQDKDLRFFIQIGDWTYPDTTERKYGYRFNSKWNLLDKSYQSKYDANYPFTREVLNHMPVSYVYDDHDFAANNPDGTDSNKQKSISAYKMFFPHYPLANPNNGIWQKFNFSNVDFFVLDLRSQRSSMENAFDKSGKLNLDKDYSILAGFTISGQNQKDWFFSELKNSKAKWKVIVSTVIFNPSYAKVLDDDTLMSRYSWMKKDVIDKWAGYKSELNEVIKFIKDNNIKNIIFISGDTHSSYIDDGTNSEFPEISASNLDVPNSHVMEKMMEVNLNIWNKGYYKEDGHAFGKVTFKNNKALLEVIDDKGNVVVTHTIDAK